MRGVKSQGMVLCASPADGTKVELLAPVDLTKVKPGDRIYFEGMEGKERSNFIAHIAQVMPTNSKILSI